MTEKKSGLERFLFHAVYHHPSILAQRRQAQNMLREMFEFLVNDPTQLPAKFHGIAETDGLPRAVADYLAGMTDRFAFDRHRQLAGC
jgi:dGTPase